MNAETAPLPTDAPKTVSVHDLVNAGARNVVLDVEGSPLPARLRRRPTSGPELAARRRLETALAAGRAALVDLDREPAEGVDADAGPGDGLDVKAWLRQRVALVEGELAADPRREALTEIVAWLASWDAADPGGSPLPLDVDSLYGTELPTGLWDAILAAIHVKRAELDGVAPAPEEAAPTGPVAPAEPETPKAEGPSAKAEDASAPAEEPRVVTRAQAFAEYFRLLALEEGGVALPDASIPVVAQTVAGMQEMVEGYMSRFGLAEAWAGGARALIEDGRAPAPAGPSPEEIRAALFQAFVFRLMWDRHGIDLGDFHEVPAIPEAVGDLRLFIEEELAGGLAGTAATIRVLMGT